MFIFIRTCDAVVFIIVIVFRSRSYNKAKTLVLAHLGRNIALAPALTKAQYVLEIILGVVDRKAELGKLIAVVTSLEP